MELAAVYRCIAALDVHQAKVTVCVLYETNHGDVVIEVPSTAPLNGSGEKWRLGWRPFSRSLS